MIKRRLFHMIYNKMQRKDIKSMFFPSNKPSALEQLCPYPYFKIIMSLQRVVGFLLLKSCLMALAKTLAFPLPSF